MKSMNMNCQEEFQDNITAIEASLVEMRMDCLSSRQIKLFTPTISSHLRYIECCKKHGVLPKSAVLSWLQKAVKQKINRQKCTIEVSLDQLENCDLSPLRDVLLDVRCGAVDILCKSSSSLKQESILSLMNEAKSKLRVVDLRNTSLGKDILCDIFQVGLECQVLYVRFNEFKTLNFPGKFMLLHTLNLDFCSSLTALEIDCFAHMPNLMRISICGTKVANLWTTSAALSRLTSLVELRFQNCMCCKVTGPCPALSRERRYPESESNGAQHSSEHSENQQTAVAAIHSTSFKDKSACLVSEGDLVINHKTRSITQNSANDRLVNEVSSNLHGISLLDLSSDANPASIVLSKLQIEVSDGKMEIQEESNSPTCVLDLDVEDSSVSVAPDMNVLHNPSPICFENHYREYMITSLPNLQVLDNLPIRQQDREKAKTVFSTYFEYLPYKRQHRESITSILHMRETGTSGIYKKSFTRKNQSSFCPKSEHFYTRSICAAKLGSSAWPILFPMSQNGSMVGEDGRRLRPRQFEYHPSDSTLMGFGTLGGEVVVVNHEKGSIFSYIPAFKPNTSAIALCWLPKHPSKLLAGFDNGSLRLYDINQVTAEVEDGPTSSTTIYDDFNQLTSVHVNATEEKFLASGYSRKLAVYDVCTGRRLQLFTDIHQESINVAKFAHHSPHLLVTSSYDRDVKMWDIRQKPTIPCYAVSSTRGNVMVCFSPDDLYLLVSAVDNEVKQLFAVDGKLHTRFEISPTGSSHNFTRSYYMNGRDYIISGSSDESVLRICCGQTGRRLRDIHLEDRRLGSSIYVQSLRGDPFRHFHMALLAAYVRPCSPSEIIKVNLLG